MKMLSFAMRNTKEMVRDKLNIFFGLGFPAVIMLLLTLIQSNIPVDLFSLSKLTPGVAVFGLSFVSLFSGITIAKDRSSSFMVRLAVSPLSPADFILGYTLPLLPLSVFQSVFCFLVAMALGLEFTVNIFVCIAVLIPAALVYIAIGLLCGSALTDKQVGGICGALLTNLSAWLSGTWFDLELVGGVFKKIADVMPFSHAVNAGRYALSGEYTQILPELAWVLGYAVVLLALAAFVFMKKIKSDNK